MLYSTYVFLPKRVFDLLYVTCLGARTRSDLLLKDEGGDSGGWDSIHELLHRHVRRIAQVLVSELGGGRAHGGIGVRGHGGRGCAGTVTLPVLGARGERFVIVGAISAVLARALPAPVG